MSGHNEVPRSKPATEPAICNRCQKPFQTPDKKRIHTCPKCSKINEGIRTPRCETQGCQTGDFETIENIVKRDSRKAGAE